MKTKGAVLWGLNEKWSVEEIELDPPQEGELLVEFEATGLCHSDHHIRTGDMFGVSFPLIGGHEGAGIVQEVGPGARCRRGRPRGHLFPAGVRTLPLVRQRASEPL